jgi:hypothetical protein
MFVSRRYQRVPSSNIEDEASEYRREKFPGHESDLNRSPSYTPWMISTTFFATLSLCLITIAQIRPATTNPGAFETDFAATQLWVEYEERAFTGKLSYVPLKRKLYRDIDPTQPQYFGKPNPEMDALWDDLLRNEFTPMTVEEAAPFTPTSDGCRQTGSTTSRWTSYIHYIV